MRDRSHPRGGAALYACAAALSACASNGQDWVAESPYAGRYEASSVEEYSAEVRAVTEAAAAEQEQVSGQSENGLPAAGTPNAEFRVIHLGESYAEPSAVPAQPAETEGPYGSDTYIRINEPYDSGYYYPSYYPYYGGYYRGGAYGVPDTFRGSDSDVSRASGPAPIQPGQSWPSVPNYGPPFPYRTAPASPWAPAR